MAPEVKRPVTRPNSFIFTLFGDVVERWGGEHSLAIGTLIRLMGAFGVSEAAVRQAASRIARQGWLVAHRRGTRAFYAVTERGRRRIEELNPRIYGPVIEWDGRWRILTYSVEESRRERRDRLRKELAVLGWAPLSASVWITPSDSLDAARSAAENAEAADAVHLFLGEYRGPLGDRELVARCWDLEKIAAAYRDFIDRYATRLQRERERGDLSDEDAFVERLWLVHDYRKFAYIDPGLPSELVPAHWPGTTAAAIFREFYALLGGKSHRYFNTLARQVDS
ncbi:MAG TPA: PaaX family transcriptional regulator C-terminal domain-containing protein [Candidatus Baltobacteraceae bacterium]|jgi:phenylacetic acid degradation operon negative regulatory protein|nr:PaaX family transcriptional regulator C-terminal domain-containing protein [Candidatus Baltobacteraceae bacterium]